MGDQKWGSRWLLATFLDMVVGYKTEHLQMSEDLGRIEPGRDSPFHRMPLTWLRFNWDLS